MFCLISKYFYPGMKNGRKCDRLYFILPENATFVNAVPNYLK